MATIIIPTPLRKFTQSQFTFETTAKTVGEAINELINCYPELKNQILDEQNNFRPFINFFVGDSDIRTLNKEQTPLGENDVLSIIPAIAGGL
ncbi:MAG: MoaD/ThiS family protein [Bacteroidia bacterium]|nr:MoaD/ThiS family protein [Bacteroidia bacterium]